MKKATVKKSPTKTADKDKIPLHQIKGTVRVGKKPFYITDDGLYTIAAGTGKATKVNFSKLDKGVRRHLRWSLSEIGRHDLVRKSLEDTKND